MHEQEDAASRVTAGLGYLNSGGGEELRAHYLWLLEQMMGNLCPRDLTTDTIVSLVALLIPDHARALPGLIPPGPNGGRSVLRLVTA